MSTEPRPPQGPPHSIELRDGRLYIGHAVYDALFARCVAAALLWEDGQWWLIPLLSGGGGLQLKVRTASGDRVIESQEFFRQQGIEDSPVPQTLQLVFSEARGAFTLQP
jgi:hypothetical protein